MKTFDEAAVKKDLLWQGYDDWTGLWEAVWWIQTEYPELVGQPAKSKARMILSKLLAEDLINLCFLDEDTSTETPIAKEEALRIIQSDNSWEPPGGPKHQLRFLTTEKGAKPLFKHAEAQP